MAQGWSRKDHFDRKAPGDQRAGLIYWRRVLWLHDGPAEAHFIRI